ncbi:MAG: GntR family transcriptional regulator [Pseudomonadota bacterium]
MLQTWQRAEVQTAVDATDTPAPRTLAEEAYQRLKADIVMCRLAPGARFSELQLSEHYTLGRAALRSALTRLCASGLVESIPRRGYAIAPITVKSVTDLFDLRLLLEPQVAERATPHIDVDLLRELNRKPQDVRAEEEQLAFLHSNQAFHVAIAQATGNQRTVELISDLFEESTRLVNLGLFAQPGSTQATNRQLQQDAQHEALLDAFARRDAAAAWDAAASHVRSSKEHVLAQILRGDIEALV